MKTHNWSIRKGLRRKWRRKCASAGNFVLRGEQLEDRSLLAGDAVAAFAFTLTDSNGAALTSPAKVGDTVYLKATVQDVRSASVFDALLAEIQAANPGDSRTANDLKGFFQAYLNLDFDESVLTSINTSVSQFTFGTGVSSTSAFSLESADKSGVVDNVNGRLINFGDVATNFGNTPNQNGNVLPFFTAPFRINRVPLLGVNDTASVNQGSAVEIRVLDNDSVTGSASFTGSPADLSNFFSGQAAVIFRGGDDPNTRSSIMPLATSAQYSFSNTSLSLTGRKEIVPNSITGLPAGATAVIREANGASSDGNPSNNVIFFTPAANSSGTQTFSYKLRNADDPNGPTQTRTVTVMVRPVNQTPSFSTSTPASQTINANTGSQSNQVINLTNISAGVNETQGLRFVVTSNNTSLLPNNSFTSNINSSTGTGTISFKTALNVSGNVTVSVQLFDDGFDGVIGVNPATGINDDAQSTVRQFSYVVNAVNGAPQFVTSSGALSYTEGDSAQQIDPGLVLTDSNGITGGRVTISGGLPEDELAFNVALVPGGKPAQISVTKDSFGSMIISGNGTPSEYQRVFRGITYRNLSGTPSTAQRTVTFSATDNGSPPTTGTGTRTIVVSAFNNAPALGPASAASSEFNVGGPSIAIASGLTLADDGPALKSASVRITSGLQPNLDQLTFVAQSGITGNYDASTGILNFTNTNAGSPASVEAYLNTLKSVRFSNSSSNPGSATRTVLISVDDGSESNATAQVTRGINIRTNAAPVLSTKATKPPTYTEQRSGISVDTRLTLTDDSGTLLSATVKITDGYQPGFDTLTSKLNRTIDKVIATDTSVPGQITFTSRNASSPAPIKYFLSLLKAVKFASTNDNPGASRTILFTVDDGSPANATSELARTVSIKEVNDAPRLAPSAGSASYTSVGKALVVDGALSVSDPDSTQMKGATVKIAKGYKSTQDVLTFTSSPNVTGVVKGSTLTLTGIADVAEYAAVLQSVAYENISSAPTSGARTISFTVTDSAGKKATLIKRTITFELGAAPQPSSVSGYVYLGGSAPGVRQAADSGVEGVVITLTRLINPGDPPFTPITTTTDQAGFYQFSGLAPGIYLIAQTQPASLIDGPENVGSVLVTVPDGTNDLFEVDLSGNGGQNLANNNFREALNP